MPRRSIFRLPQPWLRGSRLRIIGLAIAGLTVARSHVARASKTWVVLPWAGIALPRVRSRSVEIISSHPRLRSRRWPLRPGVVAKRRSRRPLIRLATRLRSIWGILLAWSYLILRPRILGLRLLTWSRVTWRRVLRLRVMRLRVVLRSGVRIVWTLAECVRLGKTQRDETGCDRNRMPRPS